MEYYSAVKKKEIKKITENWMDIESITLNEVTQTQKDKYDMYLFICRY